MKSSDSPCPVDQISILCVKHCSYLRSHVTEFIRLVLSSGQVPSYRKKVCAILMHKSCATNHPSNFCPITLEFVPLKCFIFCLGNSLYHFLSQNYGSFRTKVRSNHTIGVKNPFGEVHHDLILKALKCRHIPNHILVTILSLFTNFQASMLTPQF